MGRVLTAIKQLVLAGDLDLQVLCDQIVSVLLGYKMTGELKGENHNKVFYKVKQQVYILF